MDVYLLQSPLATSPGYRFWEPPQLLCYQGNGPQGFNIVTAGGLIRDRDTIYMVVVDDLSLLGWSSCCVSGSSTRAKDHRHCTPVSKYVYYNQDPQRDSVGTIGTLVHFSLDQGYGLVRINRNWIQGDMDEVSRAAISIDRFADNIDRPESEDFVEFAAASGEEVTGIIVASQPLCADAGGGRRRKLDSLVINTSSYAVKPEDCGIWVRRSIASNRPLLLGHVIGFSENGAYSTLMLPFVQFGDDLRHVVRRRDFNLVG
jgi:hypothetical protein